MKNEKSHIIKKWSFLLLSFLLLAFTSTRDTKSEYNVPIAAYVITTTDLDVDGDVDIVIGNNYNTQTKWGGISTLNNELDHFTIDTTYLFSGRSSIIAADMDANITPDIITQAQLNENSAIAVLFDFGERNQIIKYIILDYIPGHISIGDINGDLLNDIVFTNNINQLWGIVYNNGLGNFSEPEYYNLSHYPGGLTCADLDMDGKDEIIISGKTEIFFHTDSGFESIKTDNLSVEVKTADFDQDGDLDIFSSVAVMGNTNVTYLIENLGNREFNNHGFLSLYPVISSYFSIADFNMDNLPDLLFQSTNYRLMLLYNNGSGDFQLSDTVYIPLANYGQTLQKSACADFDNNGYPDIATIRYIHREIPANVDIQYNDGKGNFLNNPISVINEKENKTTPLSAYPNPFSQSIKININSSFSSYSSLSIYNINGQLIKNIEKSEIINHIYQWDATDKNGKEVMPGIYFIRLLASKQIYTQSIIYMK